MMKSSVGLDVPLYRVVFERRTTMLKKVLFATMFLGILPPAALPSAN